VTSESKRSIVAGAVKLGIEDYILSHSADERAARYEALRLDGGAVQLGGPVAANPRLHPPPAPAASATAASHRRARRRRHGERAQEAARLVAPHVSMNGCVSARDALQMCQTGVPVVVIDL